MNDYYVYIYYRLDTNEPFYVGKGHNYRWKDLRRKHNKHFMNIIKNIPIIVVIEKDNLTDAEALYWEEEIIRQLVFEYGFSIDIPNNRSNDHYCHLVNMTWGGEGTSGRNPFENKTTEEIEEISKKLSISSKRIHCDKKKEELEEWNNKISKSLIGHEVSEETKKKIGKANKGKLAGENNPNYGKDMSGKNNPNYGKHHSDESKQKMSESKKGKNNPIAKSVICITTKRIFYTAKEGAEYYKCQSSHIGGCCRGEKHCKTAGKLSDGTKLTWMFLEDFLNKCEYILL